MIAIKHSVLECGVLNTQPDVFQSGEVWQPVLSILYNNDNYDWLVESCRDFRYTQFLNRKGCDLS